MKFLYLRHATQFDDRCATRFFRRHSGAQIVFNVHGQMAFQFFGEFALAPRAIEHSEFLPLWPCSVNHLLIPGQESFQPTITVARIWLGRFFSLMGTNFSKSLYLAHRRLTILLFSNSPTLQLSRL